MTPAICVSALAVARCPIVATWHAAGGLGWMRAGVHCWGFLLDRIDWRIAVSQEARASAQAWVKGWEFEVIPNGVLIPPAADPANRDDTIVFIGRHDRRKGMPVLLKAWPDVHRRTGARLRLIGADPLAVQLLLAQHRISSEGIDILGFLAQEKLTAELLRAKALAVPSVGQESFGMVLTRGFACAVPVVASDIPGYRAVMTEETGVLFPPGDHRALADALVGLFEDEPRRRLLGEHARRVAVERYSWDTIAERLEQIYEDVAA
jgi:phosphatidylinositol alpha-mannosyltransferase